jgi:hypothetical protein
MAIWQVFLVLDSGETVAADNMVKLSLRLLLNLWIGGNQGGEPLHDRGRLRCVSVSAEPREGSEHMLVDSPFRHHRSETLRP